MKTAFSLQSQLDSAGPGASQNLIFSMFFEVLVVGVFLGPLFLTFIDFWLDLASHWDPILAQFGEFLGFEIDAEKLCDFGQGPVEEGDPLEL